MDTTTPIDERVLSFRHPKRFFSDLEASRVARLVSAGLDIALVVVGGVIKDVSLGNPQLIEAGCAAAWRGKAWLDVVTPESVPKIESLLKASPRNRGRWREVTHRMTMGSEIPLKFTTVGLGSPDAILALGRDLRAVATLQQRLLATHQDLEREYASMRDAESRYRILFNTLSEAVVVVSAADGLISELNSAAAEQLGIDSRSAGREHFSQLFDAGDRNRVDRMIEHAVSNGSGEVPAVSIGGRDRGALRATSFRQGADIFVIVSILHGRTPVHQPISTRAQSRIERVMENLPDGLVVTTSNFRVLSVNTTFLDLVQASDDRQVVGDQLSTWLFRSQVELTMLESNLSRRGTARNFVTVLRDRFGGEEEVELSAATADLDGEKVFGFSIRQISKRMEPRETPAEWLPSTAEQVTSLVGQVPLKDIVKASTDLIEKVCIETALELSHDSRASAAEILGLSRQGLYSKLKRYGVPDSN